ncbi:LuxR family transcriptional regulator AbsR2 [Streptomyces gilvus]|uniref:LuxR family transcriptional regulator AbsR2 n=1 Tax=Streptomyces gilvus TaxID=2920937 RepID=UPI001F0DF84F|nr:LuxR family transcriptional regulator [Streptomyces sp. CME 23]MCH5670890.1 LuxR C-terminal-related transcriptional regulator [Streptomyces sp. CME 23]
MTTFERDAKTLELPWRFTGREDELELIRRALTAGHLGIVVTGPAGCGKTRLVTEAVRGSDRARAAGTPGTRHIPFAAFAHLLPETVSLHRAVQLLSGVRLLLIDDAHLLDDASAALVHQLAVHGRTRLIVVAADDVPCPGAVSRLWTGELLPRLALEPLPREDTEQLLAAGVGGPLEPLTLNRLLHLSRGDPRLLRDLADALRERGLLTRCPETDQWTWRGPLPLTATVRERGARLLDHPQGGALTRLAFSEPLPLAVDDFDLGELGDLEALEADHLIRIDDDGAVRLARPLHGPVLRAAAGRLRARRLARTPEQCAPALAAERAALTRGIEQTDVRALPAPVGEWLAQEGVPVPAGHAAVRARFSRLRGELREAAAWAREGLREAPGDVSCRTELALAAAQSGDTATAERALAGLPALDGAAAWLAVARGDVEGAALEAFGAEDAYGLYDAVRLGVPEKVADRLPAGGVFALHAQALAQADGPGLDRAAEVLEERGFLLFAAEARAQAVRAHRDPHAARTSRTRAVALARRCQGARTPALSGLVLGELTARQRQIVALAAAGLSNRQIAERLTLSVRTVGNHLYGAYARLGANDRSALPWLMDLPDTETA